MSPLFVYYVRALNIFVSILNYWSTFILALGCYDIVVVPLLITA